MTDPEKTQPSLAGPLPDGVSDTFVRPCLDCGSTVHVIGGQEQPHEHDETAVQDRHHLAAHAFWQGYDAARGQRPSTGGAEAIAAERQRQIDEEGFTPKHDGEHSAREFVQAARAYSLSANGWLQEARLAWPWDQASFKPSSGRRDLVKAGALIAAAIDRLDQIKAQR